MSNLAGSGYATTYSLYYNLTQAQELVTEPILQATNCSGSTAQALECLKNTDAQTLVDLPEVARFVVVDGVFVIANGLQVTKPSKVNRAHVMIGFMRDDGAAFISAPTNGDLTQELEANGVTTSIVNSSLFPVPDGFSALENVFNVTARAVSDSYFRCLDQATAFSAIEHNVFESTWFYQFNRSYQTPGFDPNPPHCDAPADAAHPNGDPSGEYYKCHSGELFYVFGSLPADLPYRDEHDLPFMKMSLDTWTSFARTFNPNPDPAFLAARGFTDVATQFAAQEKWVSVTASNMNIAPLRQLQWGSFMTSFEEGSVYSNRVSNNAFATVSRTFASYHLVRMAQNYNPQVQYPHFRSNGFRMSQYKQPPASLYPNTHAVDISAVQRAQGPQSYAAYEQSTEVYQPSQGEVAGSQAAQYPSVQTQVAQPFSEQHSPLTFQPAGPPRHRMQAGFTPVVGANNAMQAERYQVQSRAQPLPRPATTAPQVEVNSGSSRFANTPSPTSPTRASQFRRPLPQRPGDALNGVISRKPFPGANSPPAVAPSLHRPSYSVDVSRTLPAPSVMAGSYTNPGATVPQLQSPRPLPDPIPRSTRSLDLTRSPSPMKQTLDTSNPLPKPGQKFVPLWKRSLPTPQPPPVQGQSSNPNPPTVLNNNIQPPMLQRSKTATIRPLPPSPGQTHSPQPPLSKAAFARAYSQDSSGPPYASSVFSSPERSRPLLGTGTRSRGVSPIRPQPLPLSSNKPATTYPDVTTLNRVSIADSTLSSDSEDMYDNPLLRRPDKPISIPSPTYGIRDLPGRLDNPCINPSAADSSNGQRSPTGDNTQAKQQSGGPRSMASRIAALTLTRPPETEDTSTKPTAFLAGHRIFPRFPAHLAPPN
ncbi:hypothetical protein NM688_g9191 [Phlebia brevispora]|uniref:Uncharacterized protein n=1 Tax=Phlebia brevispora TaxID=194682 RepID=A0ACC1RIJ9_9APHY|nr:hypothetical protein NM688_g9191 [Phlebia brevispora]